MAEEQVSSDHRSSASELEDEHGGDEDCNEPVPKRVKVQWQETLLSLIAAQQEQLAVLTRQSNMAVPTPSTSSHGIESVNTQTSTTVTTSFRLAEFNPDISNYPIEEWLDVATKLKEELNVGDILMIAKAGEALKGRGHRYYCDWRPVSRTWDEFCKDLIVTFPDRETAGARAYTAATLKSRDCDSMSDYGIRKLRAIRNFCSDLPWSTILSMVEFGLENSEAQASIRIQQPSSERELLKLLSESDARRRKQRVIQSQRAVVDPVSDINAPKSFEQRKRNMTFKGECFKCGKSGHRQNNCNENTKTELKTLQLKKDKDSVPVCDHCKKIGHMEKNCWFKNGKPKKLMLVKRGRDLATSPIATLICNNKALTFKYLLDSGADVSIISKSAADRLDSPIQPATLCLSGLGDNIVYTIGTCKVIAVLPKATVEILFTVVADNVIPENLDAVIGWDVIGRQHLRVEKNAYGLELCHDLHNVPKVLTCLSLNNIDNINAIGCNESTVQNIKRILHECRNITADVITTGKLNIKLKDNSPVAYRPRRLAYAERVQVRQIVSELLEADIIRESQSEYASPIVLVQKKNGDARLCVDYRDVNKRVVRERYPLPLILDQIDSLCDAQYFITLDMKAGFYQMEIEENVKHITAFITPDGLYEYNRMPFGFANSPAVYQRAIDKALGVLKGTTALVYMDDVLIPSKTIQEGLDKLKIVLRALATSGFKLNYEKCTFFAPETEYLGVVVSNGTVRPSTKKVIALREAPIPSNVKSVRQFMGLANYFRRFIEKFAVVAAPITALLRKNTDFKWSEECENARQNILKKLTSEPVLKIFNPELECELHTDASSIGIGATLLQSENGVTKPIAYFSRRTTDYEAKYHSYDLETLALVEAVEHFRVYLYGRHFTAYTDCNSLRATALKKTLHPRVARWWIKLQDYDFSIEYRPGRKMAHVDYLSRNPINFVYLLKNKNQSELTLKDFQNQDEFCQDVLENPNSSLDYEVHNGLVVTKSKPVKYFVPVAARLQTMKVYHDQSSHIGWNKCIAKMREELFWPKMGQCVKKYIRNCRSCILGKSHTGRRAGLFQKGEKPKDILDTWHIDHAGPMVKSNGCTQILVIVDAFSKYCYLRPIKKKSTEDTITALHEIFMQEDKPRRIIADRAAAFTSIMFQNFLSEQDIKLHHIATGMPRGNGQVERLMRTLFNLLRSTLMAEKENTWVSALQQIETVLNTTIHSSTGFPPTVLHCGKNPRLPISQQFLPADAPAENFVDPDKAVEAAKANLKCIAEKQAQHFNLARYAPKLFTIGDCVAVEDSQLAGGGKLKPKYRGPFKVCQILPNERYLLQKGNRKTVAAHEQLRLWPAVEQ